MIQDPDDHARQRVAVPHLYQAANDGRPLSANEGETVWWR
jgi:hypothetical protein